MFVILIISAYLLGSIPFGLIIAAAHGKDLRKIGSGNIGATNLSRALGKKWAYFCFFLDVLKGLVPMLAAGFYLGSEADEKKLFLWLAAGCFAVIGHIFPVYIGFKGGKGVATSFGVALGLWPYYTISAVIAFAIWAIVALKSKYISLASVVAAVFFPVVLALSIFLVPDWRVKNLWPLFTVAIAAPVIVVVRHRENIKRIVVGTENKISSKSTGKKPYKDNRAV